MLTAPTCKPALRTADTARRTQDSVKGRGLVIRVGTSIDLPATDDQLKHLLAVLIAAFGEHAKTVMRGFGWI
jgi:hypothetical protein